MFKNLRKIKTRPRQHYGTKFLTSHDKFKDRNLAGNSPIITCKNEEFNLYLRQLQENSNNTLNNVEKNNNQNIKFGTINLASNGWKHRKSKGDFFTIHPTIHPEIVHNTKYTIEELQADCKFDYEIIKNLRNFQIDNLTEIQATAIPKILKKNHVLIAAETGCGKTLAYLIPLLQQILNRKINQSPKKHTKVFNQPLALILTPGRELAAQIGDVAMKLSTNTGIGIKTIFGGNTKEKMLNPKFEEIDLLVGSIGTISKLVTTGIYKMSHVNCVVLDEADTLLDDSFSNKLEYFLKKFPFHGINNIGDAVNQNRNCQLILAAATMPTNIDNQLGNIIDTDTIQGVFSTNLHRILPHVQQRFLRMNQSDRPGQLFSIIKKEIHKNRPVIIFGNQSPTSDYISIFLNDSGINCVNLNGNMLSKIRTGRFERFQNGAVDVLATTDICSRGLDTTRARHVINFDFPLHLADYIHRCGRIGRLGSDENCLVTNFVSSQREIHTVQLIEHAARTGGFLPKVNANITNIIQSRIMKEIEGLNKL